MDKNFEENVYRFLERLKHFEYRIEVADQIWDIIFPHDMVRRTAYHHIRVTKDQKIFYVHHYDGRLPVLEVQMHERIQEAPSFGSLRQSHGDFVKGWSQLISSADLWLKIVKKDWIKANQQIWLSYPLNRRSGIVCSSLVRESPLEVWRIDKELGKMKSKQFIRLVERREIASEYKAQIPSMTASDYFEYCKIAYLSGRGKEEQIDEKLSGREMYQRYADGRHEGLLDIDANSKEEFADWIDGKHPKKNTGGHPWEIKRGGNTTHIDLFVKRPNYQATTGFIVGLRGASSSRLRETICMFLGLHAAGFPITIDDSEGIAKRLLGQDNIGIVPCFHSLHRANQNFHEHEFVYDVMYYDDLGRYKKRITPFITWEPLPILKVV